MFIDEAIIEVRAGNGGNGLVSFRREKYVAKGGPDGGDGGDGGDVIFAVDPQLSSLLDFEYTRVFAADSGRPGERNYRTGKSGKSLRVRVPLGTVIRNAGTGELVCDLRRKGQELVVAFGGVGGRGNAAFKGPTRQTPRFCERGERGDQFGLKLELKLLADVGLIGFPNAGKSSFLARVSAARPKVADYPFTTLVPGLGVHRVDRETTLVIADMPGLIEGAHTGVGLGDAFLRHIERTRLLIHFVDVSLFERPDPLTDFEAISHELESYGHGLMQLPRVIALNKMDIAEASAVDALREALAGRGLEIFAISAATGAGVDGLMNHVGRVVRELRAVAQREDELVPLQQQRKRRRERKPIRVTPCDDGGYTVGGTEPEEAADRLDLNTEGGILRLQEVLGEMGVLAELERLGVGDGDTVRIGDIEFDYVTAASVFDEYLPRQ